MKEKSRKETEVKIMRAMRVEIQIEKMRKIRENKEKGEETLWIKLGKEEHKWEMIEKKRNLRGRRERIEDLT